MNNPYRAVQPAKGWWRVQWRDSHQHPLDVELALSCLKDVPGCTLHPQAIEVPHTAWMLSAAESLWELCDVAPPKLEQPAAVDWDPLRPLYGYQQDAASFIVAERGCLVADVMGLGKTSEAIVAAERLRRAYGSDAQAIIVAPLMVRETWKHELLTLGAIESESQFCALATRDLTDPSYRTQGVRYYFLHYDVARAWWSRLTGPARPVAILDEAHWIRNARTQRAKGAAVLAGMCRNRILLTGTPLDNRPSDLWFPLTVATGTRTWGGPLDFRKRYAGAEYNGYGWEDTVPTRSDELRQRMAPFFLRRTAEDVGLQLPSLTRQSMLVDFESRSRGRHDGILSSVDLPTLVRALVSGHVQDDVLPILTALRKVTSRAKVAATVAYVSNALDQGEAVVVSCWEREIAERLRTAIDAPLHRKFLVSGDLPQAQRAAAIESFQQVPSGEPAVMVSTLGTLREGVTLHRARIIVVHDLHWVLNHLLQVEARIHRIGQLRPCQSVWMLAKDSIDTLLAPLLLTKARYAEELLGITAGADALAELELDTTIPQQTVGDHVERLLNAWRA